MKPEPHSFISHAALAARLGTVEAFFNGQIEYQGKIGFEPIDHEFMQRFNPPSRDTLPLPLIGCCGICKAVTQYIVASVEGRTNSAVEMLASGRVMQERLSEGFPLICIALDEQPADALRAGRPTRFAGFSHR